MGVENVNTDGGLVEETFLATSSINETSIKGNDTPFYEGKKSEAKQSLTLNDGWMLIHTSLFLSVTTLTLFIMQCL